MKSAQIGEVKSKWTWAFDDENKMFIQKKVITLQQIHTTTLIYKFMLSRKELLVPIILNKFYYGTNSEIAKKAILYVLSNVIDIIRIVKVIYNGEYYENHFLFRTL